MSLDKKFTVLLIMTISFFVIFFGIVVLGSILTELQLLCVWISLGVAIVYAITSLMFFLVARKKDKKNFDDMD